MNFITQDEEIWRTDDNGKRYQIDTETKEVIKGNIGVSKVGQSSESTKLPDFEEFANRPENKGKKRSRQVFDYMMTHYVRGIKKIKNPAGYPEGSEIVFRRESAGKTSNDMNDDKIKALPFIEDVYRTGKLVKTEPDSKSHSSKNDFFYTEKYIEKIGLKVTVCASRVAIDVKNSEYRHYLISKADKANDEKIRGSEGGFCYPSRPDASKPLTFKNIITNDAENSKQIFEFVDFTVEKVNTEKQATDTMKNTPNGAAYKPPLAFDASTKRRFDDNGFLHVDGCHITKEQVAPYYGFEIPDYERFGLDPKKIYYGYRSAEELQKGLDTFNGLPLLLHHHPESAEEPQKEYRVGSVGTSAVWNAPYIDNVLSITDKTGIKAVQDGTCRQISSAYQYDPDFTKGEFDGQAYDFIMRNIRGNHVALVEEGRAGPDVVVADAQITNQPKGKLSVMLKLKNFFKGAFDTNPMKDEVARDDDNKVIKVKAIIEGLGDVIPPEKLQVLQSILDEMAEEQVVKEKVSADQDESTVDPVDSVKLETDGSLNAAEAYRLGEKDQIRKEEREEMPGGKDDSTAELIAAGENHERDKLMSEHMKADDAWDACGMDSDDPAVKEAFTKGFAWGMKDGEKDGRREEERRFAQDAAVTKAVDRAVKQMEAQFNAAAEVSRVVGDINPMAFDSVPSIYVHALRAMGIPDGAYSEASAQDVFRIAVKQHEIRIAQDAKIFTPSAKFEGDLAGLNDIKH